MASGSSTGQKALIKEGLMQISIDGGEPVRVMEQPATFRPSQPMAYGSPMGSGTKKPANG